MAMVMLVAGLGVAWRAWMTVPIEETMVVEVLGDVPRPGFHVVSLPATAHSALLAAGVSSKRFVDARLSDGTRILVEEDGSYRLERMDELLVFGLPLNLNMASASALEAIPGVGPSRSAAIVQDREQNGFFEQVDDVVRVPGIGPGTLETIRPFVVVSDG